ncbi:hypothetical protein OK016_23395 [Vibrio chagasii]|nr:hypothetical protein [Vibrio chagasii]
MMSAYLMKLPSRRLAKWYQKVDAKPSMFRLTDTPRELGKWFDRKALMSGIALMLIALSALGRWKMPQVLLPTEDTGFVV